MLRCSFIFLFVIGCSNSSNTQTNKPLNEQPAIVSARALYEEYALDSDSWEKKYKGKTVKMALFFSTHDVDEVIFAFDEQPPPSGIISQAELQRRLQRAGLGRVVQLKKSSTLKMPVIDSGTPVNVKLVIDKLSKGTHLMGTCLEIQVP